jgi:glycosyltransferase involved in cell wall biosynthesis
MRKKDPLITVGITTYNNEKTISRCIQSILDQTFKDFEVIIINDGSSDQTSQILENYSTDPRIQIINDNRNLGAPTRHNQLAKLARGKYLAKIDADDYMASTRLEVQLGHLKKSSKAQVVSSWAYAVNDTDDIVNLKKYKSKIDPFNILLKNTIIHSTIMAKTSWFLKNKYDKNLLRCQDVDLWVRGINPENYILIEDCLVYYREPIDKVKLINSRKFMFTVLKKNRSRLNLIEYIFLNSIYLVKYLFTLCFVSRSKTKILRSTLNLQNY